MKLKCRPARSRQLELERLHHVAWQLHLTLGSPRVGDEGGEAPVTHPLADVSGSLRPGMHARRRHRPVGLPVDTTAYVREDMRGPGAVRTLYARLLPLLATLGYCQAIAGIVLRDECRQRWPSHGRGFWGVAEDAVVARALGGDLMPFRQGRREFSLPPAPG